MQTLPSEHSAEKVGESRGKLLATMAKMPDDSRIIGNTTRNSQLLQHVESMCC